jgi:glycosyltransferase involved in cell wall biosynthesis
MKVAIVHELLVKLGGAERVAKVFADMFPDAPIYTLLYNEAACGKVFAKERVRFAPGLQKAYASKVPRRMMIGWMNTAIENFNLTDYDLVISSSSAFAHGCLTLPETKHICYCHSPARYLWDQTHHVIDQQSKRGFTGPLKKMLLPGMFHNLRLWDKAAANRPDVLLANSKTVQQRIKKYWECDADVLYPPVRVADFTMTSNHEQYFLIVSALSPFKNIELAVELFSRLPKHNLVIIGDGAEKQRLQKIAGDNVEFLGRKSDAVVKEYLENCRALLFPGEDDFGIVPVEAMACGKPVIALNRGGATETVLHKKTGLLFDEPTEKSLEKALIDFFLHEKEFDAKKIRKHAETFAQAKFEKDFMKVVKKALNK